MAKILIIAGHGTYNGRHDPGAGGFITQGENWWVRNKMFPALQNNVHPNDRASLILFDDYNVYAAQNIVSLARQYGNDTKVVEWHYDASSNSAPKGGHVIVHGKLAPDSFDKAIVNALATTVGINRNYNYKGVQGLSGRLELGNCNRAYYGGVNYRLIETAFGTNKADADYMMNHADEIAKAFLKAVFGRIKETKAGWIKDSKGWWYQLASGSYHASKWVEIDGRWYYFDSDGYAVTGWRLINDKWYLFNSDCQMLTGWQKVSNEWYYLQDDGSMKVGWIQYQDKWYYLDAKDGNMVSNQFKKVNGQWYAFNSNGDMLEAVNLEVNENGQVVGLK